MARIGYARVSTDDQHPEAQAEKLTAAGCERVFADHGVSGKLASRPEWDKCLAHLRAGDTLVIVRLDRAGRSVRHLCEMAATLAASKINLVVTDQGIDTSTAAGRLFFHILAAVAEFEADLNSERTKDGLKATTARGRNGGRKPSLAPYQRAHAQAELDAGRPVSEVAAELGVHRATLYRALSEDQAAAPADPEPAQ